MKGKYYKVNMKYVGVFLLGFLKAQSLRDWLDDIGGDGEEGGVQAREQKMVPRQSYLCGRLSDHNWILAPQVIAPTYSTGPV